MLITFFGWGGQGGLNFPLPVLCIPGPPSSFLSGSALCVFSIAKKLCNVAKFISYFSWIPPPRVFRLPPSLLPSPKDFRPNSSGFPPPCPPPLPCTSLHGIKVGRKEGIQCYLIFSKKSGGTNPLKHFFKLCSKFNCDMPIIFQP